MAQVHFEIEVRIVDVSFDSEELNKFSIEELRQRMREAAKTVAQEIKQENGSAACEWLTVRLRKDEQPWITLQEEENEEATHYTRQSVELAAYEE